ncbi:arginase family protein [Chitinophaga nivalis]|uniref:Arginase family protein n=1 Tax=Chitinophaga nivalis TaxID=2991709 RepID=A0ABT3IKH2_9BACT|nr:arginase family protein [Chitinophaga nivalis]MCW3465886.1 arginase family protein [Chitinophaga nivalis]MCW3484423.1 arginase family protein [Chitinophaga nivalis]
MKPLTIVACPSNLGLKEPAPGVEPGVKQLPVWLQQHGLCEQLGVTAMHTLAAPPYSMELDPISGVRNADAIVAYAQQQATYLQTLVTGGQLPLVIGGDCSILIGHMLGLKKLGRYGLFFLDGHTDYIPVSLSATKAAAGMDLAIVTGYAHPKLADIAAAGPYVQEANTWAVGNRYLETAYVQEIERSAIRYVALQSLRQQGIAACVATFLNSVTTADLDGFWIHVDADVLHNDIMPAVDSPQEDGLAYAELEALLMPLLRHPKAAGINITILDPDLDPTGKYTRPFIDSLVRIFQAR